MLNTPHPHNTRGIRRRGFIARLGFWTGATVCSPSWLSALNADAGKGETGMPLRTLGRTGAKVSILGLGAGCVGLSRPGSKEGVSVYRAALEAGINLVDTARIYQDAEMYLGELMSEWREKIFLVTKARPESDDPKECAAQMQESFQTSLRQLRTDHVDLLHIHMATDRDPEMILAPGGPMEFVRRMKDQGLTRFIGVSAHCHHARTARLLETGWVDVLMVALNFVDYHQYRFEAEILPLAVKHRCGILAMKVYGGHALGLGAYHQRGPAKVPAELLEPALRYSLSIPAVAGAVAGFYCKEEVEQSVRWVKRFQPLSPEEADTLREQGRCLVAQWGPRFGPVA